MIIAQRFQRWESGKRNGSPVGTTEFRNRLLMAALFTSGYRAYAISRILGINETVLDEVRLDAREWPYFRSEVDL